jgi:hypothetical protein
MISVAVLCLAGAVALGLFARSNRKDPRYHEVAPRMQTLSRLLGAGAVVLMVASAVTIIPAGHVGVQVLFSARSKRTRSPRGFSSSIRLRSWRCRCAPRY